MPLQSPHDVQRDQLLAAIRDANVANVAAVAPGDWASTSSPRVLVGNANGYIAGLHRGRLPAVEIFQESDEWARQTVGGGEILTTWVVRCHVPDLGKQSADSLARRILLKALTFIRADTYFYEGSESFTALTPGPLGSFVELRVSMAFSYCRTTYELNQTSFLYRRPGGVDLYHRPGGIPLYLRP